MSDRPSAEPKATMAELRTPSLLMSTFWVEVQPSLPSTLRIRLNSSRRASKSLKMGSSVRVLPRCAMKDWRPFGRVYHGPTVEKEVIRRFDWEPMLPSVTPLEPDLLIHPGIWNFWRVPLPVPSGLWRGKWTRTKHSAFLHRGYLVVILMTTCISHLKNILQKSLWCFEDFGTNQQGSISSSCVVGWTNVPKSRHCRILPWRRRYVQGQKIDDVTLVNKTGHDWQFSL